MLVECYKQVLKNWFGEEKSERKFIDKVIETLKKKWNDKSNNNIIFIIEAPTGYGKSVISATISLFSLKSNDSLKCIVAFPLRTLLEDQYDKFIEDEIKEKDGKRFEKTSILGKVKYDLRKKIIGKRYMHNPDSPYLIKPITLTTIDTLALTLFGIPPECLDKVIRTWDGTVGGSLGHYLFAWSSVVLSNIVLDEVHLLADSTKSLSFLIALMKIAKDFDQKLILMSATLPEALKSVLREHISGEIEFIEFDIDSDPKFYGDRIKKKYDVILEKVTDEDKFEKIINWIEENKKFSKVIVMFNTVHEAIEFYTRKIDELRRIFGANIILIHSRFSEKDREKKVKKIKNLGDKYLVISTQVIEAGVDISSNLFITDIAPANSLIQRLGRFLRYPGEEEGRIIIWYEAGEDGKLKVMKNKIGKDEWNLYKVYDYDLTNKTLNWLTEHLDIKDCKRCVKLNVHLPELKDSDKKDKSGYKDLLDYVYDKRYKDRYFSVDKDMIRDFEGIFLHLENASLVAMEKFFEMEGSFVRDELQIPVVPKSIIDRANEITDMNPIDFVREWVVPLSLSVFRRLDKKRVHGAVIAETEEKKIKPKIISKDEDSWLMSILERKYIQPKDILKYIFIRNVLAFIIDAKYDDRGLRFDENN